MQFYRVSKRHPWGDYGSILVHGMTRRGASEEGPFLLYRTGPFIPPISLPYGPVVVTDEFRRLMEGSGLFEVAFREIKKQRIVRLHWERWDLTADKPRKYPWGGEPEGYVLNRWHSFLAAWRMGQIWEAVLPRGANTKSNRRKEPRGVDLMVDPSTWEGQHFFKSKNQGWIVATPIGADWLRQHGGEWVTFEECLPWVAGEIE